MALRRKVLVYATSAKGLLVFDEPDFPEVGLQVPGGTVEPDEDILAAAVREFEEETGLRPAAGLSLLGTTNHSFVRNEATYVHRRSYFHIELPDDLPDVWHHHETTPDGGGSPILFRFFWLGRDEAQSRLGFGMEEFLDRIS